MSQTSLDRPLPWLPYFCLRNSSLQLLDANFDFFPPRGPFYLSSNHPLSHASVLSESLFVFPVPALSQALITRPWTTVQVSWLPALVLSFQFNLLPDTGFIFSKLLPLFYHFSKPWFFNIKLQCLSMALYNWAMIFVSCLLLSTSVKSGWTSIAQTYSGPSLLVSQDLWETVYTLKHAMKKELMK